MIVLGINTAENITSVALTSDFNTLSGIYSTSRNKCASMLVPYIDYTLKQSDKTIKDVDLICLCSGPGSYTSLRIGYATSKTLCIVNNIKFSEVSRFRLMLEKFIENDRIRESSEDVNIITLLPTTYGKVMSQMYSYERNSSRVKEVSPSSIEDIDTILSECNKQNSFVVGEFKNHKKSSDFQNITSLDNYFEYKDNGDSAFKIAQIGLEELKDVESDPRKAEPLYLISPF